jgi:hypothetical protein
MGVASWVQTAVGAIEFIFLWFLAWRTRSDRARWNTHERRADWYQRLVADPLIPHVRESTASISNELCAAAMALEGLRSRAAAQNEIDQQIESAMARVKAGLNGIADAVVDAARPFGEFPADRVTSALDDCESELSEWFEAFSRSAPYDGRESLPAIVARARNAVFESLMAFEFSEWGGK